MHLWEQDIDMKYEIPEALKFCRSIYCKRDKPHYENLNIIWWFLCIIGLVLITRLNLDFDVEIYVFMIFPMTQKPIKIFRVRFQLPKYL